MPASLTIRDQPSLPMHRLVRLCISGIQHRLLRSSVTLGVVVLGVAFLANTLTEAVVAASMKQAVGDASSASRIYSRFIAVTEPTGGATGLIERIAALERGGWEDWIARSWLGLDEAGYERMRDELRTADAYLRWFADLGAGHRRMLFGKRQDEDAMRWAATDAGQSEIRATVTASPGLAPPAGLLEFTRGYPAIREQLEGLAQRFDEQAHRLRASGWPLDAQPDIAAGGAGAVSELDRRLRATGAELPADRLAPLAEAAAHAALERRISTQLEHAELGTAWQRHFGELLTPYEMLGAMAADPPRAKWLREQWRSPAEAPSVDAIVSAAQRTVEAQRLNTLRTRLEESYGGGLLGAEMVWLIVVSFLVCLVGITNAMLISVLERFAEIATMKCLGALDSSVALLFLMESAALGVIGGLLGLVLGLATGFARLGATYGEWAFHRIDLGSLSAVMGGSLVVAVTLTTLAASYPAWKTSRLLPIEAMRVE